MAISKLLLSKQQAVEPQIATDIAGRLYLKQVCLMHVERGKGKTVHVTNHRALRNDSGVGVMLLAFDVCVTVHRWYNNINNQLDATITIY